MINKIFIHYKWKRLRKKSKYVKRRLMYWDTLKCYLDFVLLDKYSERISYVDDSYKKSYTTYLEIVIFSISHKHIKARVIFNDENEIFEFVDLFNEVNKKNYSEFYMYEIKCLYKKIVHDIKITNTELYKKYRLLFD